MGFGKRSNMNITFGLSRKTCQKFQRMGHGEEKYRRKSKGS